MRSKPPSRRSTCRLITDCRPAAYSNHSRLLHPRPIGSKGGPLWVTITAATGLGFASHIEKFTGLPMLDALLKSVNEAGIAATLILCLMGLAIRWLLRDRDRILALLETANADRFRLREVRADDLEKAANEYREFGETMRGVMREWTVRADAMLATIRPGGA